MAESSARTPESSRGEEERLPLPISILVIGVLSLLAWGVVVAIVAALWLCV